MEDEELVVGGNLVLYGYVGDAFMGEGFTAKGVLKALSEISGDVTVRINSGGGSAFEGQAIYSALRAHEGRVTVQIDGIAASSASLIAMAGDNVVMADGAMLMIHDPSTLTIGTASDHRRSAKDLEKLADNYASIYAKRSGKKVEDVRALMIEETWLTADEAVADGFATSVADRELAATAAFDFTKYANAPEVLRTMAIERGWQHSPQRAAAQTKEVTMTTKSEAAATSEAVTEKTTPEKQELTMKAEDTKAATERAVAAERARAKGIREAVAALSLGADFADALIDEGVSLDVARARIIDAKAEKGDTHEYGPSPAARVVADARDRFAEGAQKALMAKAGIDGGERNEFTGMSLLEIARASIEIRGEKVRATSKLEVAGQAFGVRMAGGHSTSDFPAILENIAGKAMLRGFEEQEETFAMWTSRGTLSDFKQTKRVGLDAFPSLTKVEEGANFQYGTMGDYAEPVVLATYGKIFSITRQAVINDDLGAFTRIPQNMGRAARRTVGDLAYAVLTANANMSDGNALFSSAHSNLAGSAGAPSVTTMEAAIAAMATQKDRSGNATALNIRPAFALAPYALRGTILQLLNSEYDPAKTTRAANTVRNAVTPIFDARLDAHSATAWYLATSPMRGDTIEISYLDGNAAPFLDSKDGWTIDGVEFKVRIDAAATALAWEGLYKNAGS